MTQISEGGVYTFTYAGGETPGNERTVLVTHVGDGWMAGYCVERGGYRRYNLILADDVEVAEGYEVTQFESEIVATWGPYLLTRTPKEPEIEVVEESAGLRFKDENENSVGFLHGFNLEQLRNLVS